MVSVCVLTGNYDRLSRRFFPTTESRLNDLGSMHVMEAIKTIFFHLVSYSFSILQSRFGGGSLTSNNDIVVLPNENDILQKHKGAYRLGIKTDTHKKTMNRSLHILKADDMDVNRRFQKLPERVLGPYLPVVFFRGQCYIEDRWGTQLILFYYGVRHCPMLIYIFVGYSPVKAFGSHTSIQVYIR